MQDLEALAEEQLRLARGTERREAARSPLTLPTFDGDSAGWRTYVRKIKSYFLVNQTPVGHQALFFLHGLDTRTYERVCDLCEPSEPEGKTFNELVDLIEKFFQPTPNKFSERIAFQKATQAVGESVQEFGARLNRLTRHCKFPADWLADALCTQFIAGLQSEELRMLLLSKSDITYQSALDLAGVFELNKKAASTVHWKERGDVMLAEASSGKTPTTPKEEAKIPEGKVKNPKCEHCGRRTHSGTVCPVRDAICYKCREKGHIAPICKKKKNKVRALGSGIDSRRLEEHSDSYSSDEIGMLGPRLVENAWQAVNSSTGCKEKLTYEVCLDGTIEEVFIIDTGATISLISFKRFRELFRNRKLDRADTTVVSYTGEPIKLVGRVTVAVKCGTESMRLPLYVVEGNYASILGMEWIRKLRIDWSSLLTQSPGTKSQISHGNRCNSIATGLEQLKRKYRGVFEPGVGKVKGVQIRIQLKEGAKPIFKKARPVPFSLLPKVSMELDRLESEGIIEKVDRSEWATPLVVVPKKNGALRLCADYKVTLNKQIVVDSHCMPNVDDCIAQLGQNRFFSKLDIVQAYTHIEVRPEDRDLLTINTPRGLYRYCRLPFGIASAPAHWQRTIDQILKDVPNKVIFYDDIAVGTQSVEEHFRVLEKIFSKLQENNIRVNLEKIRVL